jgi:hypothetical protein
MERLTLELTSTAEEIAQQDVTARGKAKREQAMDNFLNNFGLRLGLRFGFSIVNISDVGEPYGIEKSNTVDLEIPLVAIMELRLGSYFSIQTEFQYVVILSGFYLTDINSTWDSNLYSNDDTNDGFSFSIIQIPLLAKITFSPTPDFLIAPFAGIGFNIPIDAPFADKNPDIISLPISGIFGLNVGYELEPALLFIDLRYVHDFGEMTAEVTNTNSNLVFTGKRSSFDITFGVSFFIPFRKK